MPPAAGEGPTAELSWVTAALPGTPSDMVVRDDHAYLAVGSGLLVLDISEASNPRELSFLPLVNGAGLVGVSGDYACVVDTQGIRIFNITNPAEPQEMGNLSIEGEIRYLAMGQDYVYLTVAYYVVDLEKWEYSLAVVDISDPRAPRVVGNYEAPVGIFDMTVAGDYVYLADGWGLRIIDVSDPEEPEVEGTYITSNRTFGVDVVDDFAYVTDFYGLRIINISDPTDPQEVGYNDTLGYTLGVEVSGDLAYLAAISNVIVVDISNSSDPQEIGRNDTFRYLGNQVIVGDRLYLVDYYTGFHLLDITDPTEPRGLGRYDEFGSAFEIVGIGEHLYIADGAGGLEIVDISEPVDPQETGRADTPGTTNGVAVSGTHAYVADLEGGFRIIDVSDPAAPVEVANLTLPSDAYGVTLSGSYAYVADWEGGLRIIDVSDPAEPTEVGNVSTPGGAYDVTVAGSYAYVAAVKQGLRVIDISDPTESLEVGSYDTPGRAYHVALADDYAYVADYEAGLRIINISDPTNLSEVGSFDTPGKARGVAVEGAYAYVADGPGGLRVIDVSNPASPYEVGHYETLDSYHVVVAGGTLYVAAGGAQLQVLHLNFLPVASIDVISLHLANETEPVTFNGSGSDLDGSITVYQWRSDIDGPLGNASSFSNASLSPGNHTIYFKVQDNEGAWSAEATASLDINAIPLAFVDYILPSIAEEGEEVSFWGYGSDDGNITAFQWRSDIDGNLSTNDSFRTASLSPGLHTIYLKVMDDYGVWSEEASVELEIYWKLTAFIDEISPNSTNKGEEVYFEGHGVGQYEIISYQWRSSLNGFLSIGTNFTSTSLFAGNHTIYLKVRDSEGEWSPEASASLHINFPPEAHILSIEPSPVIEGDNVTLEGVGSDSDGRVVAYQWESDLDGPLGDSPTIVIDTLRIGRHNLTLRVQDNEGMWSVSPQKRLSVLERLDDEVEVPSSEDDGELPFPGVPWLLLTFLLVLRWRRSRCCPR
ncbi:MAG: hypothetical protein BEU05_02855 [Marine Group III euryarchaeote CG-Bathy2]|uniref:PKD/Chitinase domain-containing protein n=1 Tax=Marine Group III euryarchaeote CG-Bathy2 TaxID=1889002 RepID=A0A1J5T8F2_9ARCH|nr:MAG: hypothetical protein BEU05_02855 [Marine Group III euryarchaeote CG-Bathy2]